ncbi:hypothetical protein K505DRAFT_388109 [Melanomma pulvis-pyrius CBS 109.77]|uniref:Uncharacterized protein n=1 Tax=Melanomma pulvis-pyrius CBS 109.77 TaxID=1314802 RepID=A0A6A6XTM3_9PLEO|nr:hypothetical protein K505DRAFT_388109 [Melanomma pulvis-pyrius CBS 109.77]
MNTLQGLSSALDETVAQTPEGRSSDSAIILPSRLLKTAQPNYLYVSPLNRQWDEYEEDEKDELDCMSGGDPPQTPIKSSSSSILRSPGKTPASLSKTLRESPLKGSGIVNNLWDPDEDEFPNWPGNEELDQVLDTYRSRYGTAKHTRPRGILETAPPTDGATTARGTESTSLEPCHYTKEVTEEELLDMASELKDKSCGNPLGTDLHDEVMEQFFSKRCPALPASFPARHMHLLEWQALLSSSDQTTQLASPRLCDAVATILHETHPRCLSDFLDPNVKVFEWRRNVHRIVIRRVGNAVLVGTYRDLGFVYLWSSYVRSTIDFTGKWLQVYAGVTRGATKVLPTGPAWDEFEEVDPPSDIRPTDQKYALYVGRMVSRLLVEGRAWQNLGYPYTVEWEADGKVWNSRERDSQGLMDGADGDGD